VIDALTTAANGPVAVVPVVRLDRPTLAALAYARSLTASVRAVAVAAERGEALRIRERWRRRADRIELDLVDADGDVGDRLETYLDELGRRAPRRCVIVVLPMTLTGSWLDRVAGLGTLVLRHRLSRRSGTVAVTAPYRVR